MAREPIAAAIRRLAEQQPDRPAITCEGVTVSWGELEPRTNRLAHTMARRGVGQDDFVTIGLPNGIAFYETCIAAWKLGAVPQPVSHRLPERERAEIVALVHPPLVVTEPVAVDEDAGDEPITPDRVAPALKAPTSGGSTGRPKIIVSTADGTADIAGQMLFADRRAGQTELVPGPLYHNGPFVYSMPTLLSGGHVVVMTRFDASEALRLLEEHGVEWAMLVPTMMLRIWRLPEDERLARDLSSLRAVLHLAAPCPVWLKHAWIEWLGPERVWELYAGTEAQRVTLITGTEWLAHEGSVGRPEPGTMKATDADGDDLPPGEVGEIWMLAPDRPTYHYIGAEARARDGWESLGDLGWFDEDGYLYLADRRTDLIIAGGANIYPAEVEAALMEHPAIASCAVIGLPDEDLGHRVHAVLETTAEVSDDELRAFLAERLVRYKVPRSFERVPGQVRDDAGKVRRTALAAARRGPDGDDPNRDEHEPKGAR
ncbi:MAG TPA: AMP-binding protein [Acidimicrobiia bacterium]|jgi:bile acid-coenzyme A ligase